MPYVSQFCLLGETERNLELGSGKLQSLGLFFYASQTLHNTKIPKIKSRDFSAGSSLANNVNVFNSLICILLPRLRTLLRELLSLVHFGVSNLFYTNT